MIFSEKAFGRNCYNDSYEGCYKQPYFSVFYKRKRRVKLQEVEIGFCLLKSVKWTLDSHKRLSLQTYTVPGIGVTCCHRELRSWRHLLL